ncbi:MAG: hypothetical protein ACETWM_14065 [Candidatus Lokiarchaeia archaeon]
MKRKMVAVVAMATIAMLMIFITLPVFVAPVSAVNIQAFENNQSEQPVQSLQLDWINWWNNDTMSFFTDLLGFNISADFLSGEFVHRALTNTEFGLDFAHLVEFNDSNADGYYNFNASDQIIKQYNLLTDVDWYSFNFGVNWPPGEMLPTSINITITGSETANDDFTISFIASVYIKKTNIQFNNTQVSIPKAAAIKFGLEILSYDWDMPNSTYPAGSRYLALVITLKGAVGGSIAHNFRLANGTLVADIGSGVVATVSGTGGNVCEVYLEAPSGAVRAKFSWFNGAYNTTLETTFGKGNSYFSKSGDEMNISIAFAYNDFQYGNLIIDPYFELLRENPLLLIMTLVGFGSVIAGQALSTLLLYGGIGIVAFIALIGIIVVLARRR